ncbi:MAG: 50S ribosomal protein L24 [Alphaproteobacteria bacterium]
MAAKIRKGDEVQVIKGKDKGRKGNVLKVIDGGEKLLVEGINVAKRHTKPSQTAAGGIVTKEMPLRSANVMLVDPKTGNPTRVGFKKLEDGTKVRFAKKSGEIIATDGEK